jgi:hypothetical protein
MSLYIADDAVFFESVEPHYTTEFTGETPNTIRALSKDEIVELKQSGVRHIVIGRKNEATAFRREITNIKVADMYKLDDGRIPVVISWKHPDSSEKILSKAIAHYGEPAQFLKCCEECMELALELVDSVTAKDNRAVNSLQYIGGALANSIDEIKAIELSEGLRWKSTVRDVKAITSELADVDITTKQVRKILTTEKEFQKVKDIKLNRLKERIADNELKTWLADKDDSAISEDLSEHNLRTITITPPERITCPECDIGMLFVESDFKDTKEFDVRCSNGHLFRVVKGDSERMDGEQ